MKKLLTAAAVLLLTISLSACNNGTNDPPKNDSNEHIHVFDEWETVKKPSCQTDGQRVRYCSCGEKQDEVIPKTDHNEIITEGKKPTCTEDGISDKIICKQCDELIADHTAIPAKGHTEVIDKGVSPSCTAVGYTEGKHCSDCGVVLITPIELPVISHSYSDDYDASCNECGHIRDVSCKHNDIGINLSKEATCTENGLTEGKACKECGEILLAQSIIPAKGHTEAIDAGKSPTCTEEGLSDGKHCATCKVVLVEQNVLPATGHSFGDWQIVNDATMTEDGIKAKYCNCGAEETEVIPSLCSKGLKYQISEDGTSYTVVGIGDCADTNLRIPSIYNGLPVKTIGAKAFYEVETFTSLYISDGITIIEDYAFQCCRQLKSITLPETLEKLGVGVFYSCINLVDFPESFGKVTEIPDFSFYNCYQALEKVVIPYGITVLGKESFSACDELLEARIPTSVTTIDKNAFRQPFATTTIIYEGSEHQWQKVQKDSYWKSDNCSLEFAVFDLNDPSVGLEFYLQGSKYFVKSIGSCTDTYIIVPNEYEGLPVVGIYDNAFSGNKNIVAVVLNENTTDIHTTSFKNCTSLKYLYVMGETVDFYGSNIFTTCTSFKFNEYNNGLYIGTPDNPYKVLVAPKNTSITSFEIHPETTIISGYTFSGCNKLASVNIPDGVKILKRYTFYGTAITSLTLPDGLISIDDDALGYCNNLVYNEYGGGLYLGTSTNPYYALVKASNTSITSINIHTNTRIIAESAFYNCKSLTSVTIPDSVMYLGNYAFWYCQSLSSVTLGSSIKAIGTGTFDACTALTSITLPSSVESIGDNAFYGCTALASITIGNNVKSIGDYAFYNCTSLTSITIPASVKMLGSNAFYYCSGLKTAILNCEIIGDDAFGYCSLLKTLTIGNTVKNIGARAFESCEALTSVTIPDSVVKIGELTFWYCTALTSAKTGNGLTEIPFGMFDCCEKLRSVTIGSSVTTIGSDAFNDCSSLYTVQMGSSITHIGEYAFLNCTNLTSILIPESVVYIGKEAFNGCSRLTSIVFENTEGWYYTSYSSSTSGTSLSSSSLSSVSTAATYLKTTYNKYYWKRK